MKMRFLILLLVLFTHTTFAQLVENKQGSLVEYVNPLVGTDSDYALSNGNTYPAIALPWGMNFWTPQTNKNGNGWGYMYDDVKIRGFKQTHQPSPWINDYAAFSLFPETGKLIVNENKRASWFSHKAETAKPHYYRVYLSNYDVVTEITPTERAAQFRFTFPESDASHILIDAFNKGSMVKISTSERKITGYCRNNSGGVPENFHNYFVIVFDKDFTEVSTWKDSVLTEGSTSAEGKHVMAAITFKTKKGEIVNARVASSFISPEQAELNLSREIGQSTFDQTKDKAEAAWNKELDRVKVEGGTVDQNRTFYTALYRTMLFPRKFYELDANNKVVHYSPYNGKVLPGYMFTDNGFWDTFRAVFPYFTLMHPTLSSQIMEGLANAYNESGWLPEWASPGHRDCMVGSNSAVNIADAYLKGIRGFDINKLYEAILKNTNNAGPLQSVGRYGVEYYNKLGYIPYNVGVNENVARTLEYSFADWCISKLAKDLGRPQEEIKLFEKRALNYKNVFDPSVNFMRGKNADGTFQSPFRPDKWGDAFTEGSSWHWTWCVFHDPKGLANLMGGREKMAQRLDEMFTAAPTFDYSYYGVQIHEITEMLISNMGQYAHGNQPVQHAIYLYDYVGQPWKGQYWVRQVMDRLYNPNPDGLCGDEDNGQTSAWYVFSAMGFYPVAPGTGEYAFGSPLFKKVSLTLENGKKFEIDAPKNNPENVYVDKITLDGKVYGKNYITHSDIMKGGKIQFDMTKTPNKTRGTSPESFPYSFSNEKN
ncbi:MAG TPA: GH92 family glycosyl hydrolase [Prolixibacteraceae bacterium]|nr:GH92 family glycosyl hydrolase [Prolixibacteraceae bacterium]